MQDTNTFLIFGFTMITIAYMIENSCLRASHVMILIFDKRASKNLLSYLLYEKLYYVNVPCFSNWHCFSQEMKNQH